jgi:hypothetical protein
MICMDGQKKGFPIIRILCIKPFVVESSDYLVTVKSSENSEIFVTLVPVLSYINERK